MLVPARWSGSGFRSARFCASTDTRPPEPGTEFLCRFFGPRTHTVELARRATGTQRSRSAGRYPSLWADPCVRGSDGPTRKNRPGGEGWPLTDDGVVPIGKGLDDVVDVRAAARARAPQPCTISVRAPSNVNSTQEAADLLEKGAVCMANRVENVDTFVNQTAHLWDGYYT